MPRGVSSNGIYPFLYFYKLLQRFLIRIQQIAKGTGEEFSTDQRRDPLAHGINSMARLICILSACYFLFILLELRLHIGFSPNLFVFSPRISSFF